MKDHIFPDSMKEKNIWYSSLSLFCCVQLSRQTHSHMLSLLCGFSLKFELRILPCLSCFLSLCFQPERLPQPAAASVERSLRNISNWVVFFCQAEPKVIQSFSIKQRLADYSMFLNLHWCHCLASTAVSSIRIYVILSQDAFSHILRISRPKLYTLH